MRVTVPAQFVEAVRTAALMELSLRTDALDHRAWKLDGEDGSAVTEVRDVLAEVNGFAAVLDQIGWTDSGDGEGRTLDSPLTGRVLRYALESGRDNLGDAEGDGLSARLELLKWLSEHVPEEVPA